MWVLSMLCWLSVLGLAAAFHGSLTEAVPGGDSVTAFAVAQFGLVAVAILTDRRRRATIARIYRVPEGLVFEMPGLMGTIRRYVPQAELGRIRVSPPDPYGRIQMRLPDGGGRLVMHNNFQELRLGLPEPEHKKRGR